MENQMGQSGDGSRTDLGLDKLYEELVYSVAKEIELERQKISMNPVEQKGLLPPS